MHKGRFIKELEPCRRNPGHSDDIVHVEDEVVGSELVEMDDSGHLEAPIPIFEDAIDVRLRDGDGRGQRVAEKDAIGSRGIVAKDWTKGSHIDDLEALEVPVKLGADQGTNGSIQLRPSSTAMAPQGPKPRRIPNHFLPVFKNTWSKWI
jgi:hypothetical protein